MDPTRGPSVYKVTETDGLVLAVAPAIGSPSVSPQRPFLFTKAVFLDGFMVLFRPDPAGLVTPEQIQARTAVRIVDESNQPIIGDTRGTLRGVLDAQVAAPNLLLSGFAFRPYCVQRPVMAGDRWIFSLQNEDTANTWTCAGIFLYFQDAGAR